MATPNPMVFVNLPVADIEASVAFYKAIGFTQNPKFTSPEGTMLSIGPPHPTNSTNAQHSASTINIMLLTHQFFKSFLPAEQNKEIADAKKVTGMMLCLFAGSKDEIDEYIVKAKAAGAELGVLNTPDMKDCYDGSFADLDEHIWKLM
jgi:predicted lactoylglutathione lyase